MPSHLADHQALAALLVINSHVQPRAEDVLRGSLNAERGLRGVSWYW
jgi:hypothetical protein